MVRNRFLVQGQEAHINHKLGMNNNTMFFTHTQKKKNTRQDIQTVFLAGMTCM